MKVRSINMDYIGVAESKTTCIEAIVYPSCECGESWTSHGACGGYKPSKPIVNYGTLHFGSNDWIANGLFIVERFFRRLRVNRLRNV